MDDDRRIRFLIAPTLFLALLLLGALSNQTTRDLTVGALKDPESKLIGLIAGVIAGGGLLVFVAGYVIGTCTYFVLRVVFCLTPQGWGKFHEVAMSDVAFERVWKRVALSKKPDRRQELSAGVTFDFGVIRKKHEGIHRWLVRRWNAFSIAATSLCGLLLSFPFGYAVGIPMAQTWWLPASAAIFAVILVFVAVSAWCDNMRMLDFMASSRLCRTTPDDAEPRNHER